MFEEAVGFRELLTFEVGERMVCAPCEKGHGLWLCRGDRLRFVVNCERC